MEQIIKFRDTAGLGFLREVKRKKPGWISQFTSYRDVEVVAFSESRYWYLLRPIGDYLDGLLLDTVLHDYHSLGSKLIDPSSIKANQPSVLAVPGKVSKSVIDREKEYAKIAHYYWDLHHADRAGKRHVAKKTMMKPPRRSFWDSLFASIRR